MIFTLIGTFRPFYSPLWGREYPYAYCFYSKPWCLIVKKEHTECTVTVCQSQLHENNTFYWCLIHIFPLSLIRFFFFSRDLTPSTIFFQKYMIKTLLFDVETVALLLIVAKKLMACFFPGKKLLSF